jgi:hypothetical protein
MPLRLLLRSWLRGGGGAALGGAVAAHNPPHVGLVDDERHGALRVGSADGQA